MLRCKFYFLGTFYFHNEKPYLLLSAWHGPANYRDNETQNIIACHITVTSWHAQHGHQQKVAVHHCRRAILWHTSSGSDDIMSRLKHVCAYVNMSESNSTTAVLWPVCMRLRRQGKCIDIALRVWTLQWGAILAVLSTFEHVCIRLFASAFASQSNANTLCVGVHYLFWVASYFDGTGIAFLRMWQRHPLRWQRSLG